MLHIHIGTVAIGIGIVALAIDGVIDIGVHFIAIGCLNTGSDAVGIAIFRIAGGAHPGHGTKIPLFPGHRFHRAVLAGGNGGGQGLACLHSNTADIHLINVGGCQCHRYAGGDQAQQKGSGENDTDHTLHIHTKLLLVFSFTIS